jgi:serine/threonine-protein kinase RsbW
MGGDRLIIRNDVAELRRMSEWLVGSGQASGLSPEVLSRLEVCANEAVSNIISYAYDDSEAHDIALELNQTSTGACLIIRDDGKPFNMLTAPEHRLPTNLADAKIGGLGLPLMRGLMARCGYQRDNGFNVLSLEASSSS